MQDEFLRLQRMLKKTIVFITHDIAEAFRLADRLAIMRAGRIVQIGRPADIVLNPADDYVAQFTEDMPLLRVITAGDLADARRWSGAARARAIAADTSLEDADPDDWRRASRAFTVPSRATARRRCSTPTRCSPCWSGNRRGGRGHDRAGRDRFDPRRGSRSSRLCLPWCASGRADCALPRPEDRPPLAGDLSQGMDPAARGWRQRGRPTPS